MSFHTYLLAGAEVVTPSSVPGITAVPHEENLRYFDVTVDGPSQSPYEGE